MGNSWSGVVRRCSCKQIATTFLKFTEEDYNDSLSLAAQIQTVTVERIREIEDDFSKNASLEWISMSFPAGRAECTAYVCRHCLKTAQQTMNETRFNLRWKMVERRHQDTFSQK